MSADSLRAISKLLKPRLALPDQRVLTKGRHGEEMCFVASGAVAVHLPDNTMIELGSGEFSANSVCWASSRSRPT